MFQKLFLTFSVCIGCQPKKKLFDKVANPSRGLLDREKNEEKINLAAHPPSPTLLVRRKIMNVVSRWTASAVPSRVSPFILYARGLFSLLSLSVTKDYDNKGVHLIV